MPQAAGSPARVLSTHSQPRQSPARIAEAIAERYDAPGPAPAARRGDDDFARMFCAPPRRPALARVCARRIRPDRVRRRGDQLAEALGSKGSESGSGALTWRYTKRKPARGSQELGGSRVACEPRAASTSWQGAKASGVRQTAAVRCIAQRWSARRLARRSWCYAQKYSVATSIAPAIMARKVDAGGAFACAANLHHRCSLVIQPMTCRL